MAREYFKKTKTDDGYIECINGIYIYTHRYKKIPVEELAKFKEKLRCAIRKIKGKKLINVDYTFVEFYTDSIEKINEFKTIIKDL